MCAYCLRHLFVTFTIRWFYYKKKNNKIHKKVVEERHSHMCDARRWHLIFHSLFAATKRVWVSTAFCITINISIDKPINFFPFLKTHNISGVFFSFLLLCQLRIFPTSLFCQSKISSFFGKVIPQLTQLFPLISLYWLRHYITIKLYEWRVMTGKYDIFHHICKEHVAWTQPWNMFADIYRIFTEFSATYTNVTSNTTPRWMFQRIYYSTLHIRTKFGFTFVLYLLISLSKLSHRNYCQLIFGVTSKVDLCYVWIFYVIIIGKSESDILINHIRNPVGLFWPITYECPKFYTKKFWINILFIIYGAEKAYHSKHDKLCMHR